MTIADLKRNRIVHKWARAFACLLFVVALAESAVLIHLPRTDSFAWATTAMLASAWIVYRMDFYVRLMSLRIRQAEARAKLHETLDANFETVMERTRGRHHYEQARQQGKAAAFRNVTNKRAA